MSSYSTLGHSRERWSLGALKPAGPVGMHVSVPLKLAEVIVRLLSSLKGHGDWGGF